MGERALSQGRDIFKEKKSDTGSSGQVEVKMEEAMSAIQERQIESDKAAAEAYSAELRSASDKDLYVSESDAKPLPVKSEKDLGISDAEHTEYHSTYISDPEKTMLGKGDVSAEESVDHELNVKTEVHEKPDEEATVIRSPDFQTTEQAFAKDEGETTQPLGVSGLEDFNSDEIPESKLPELGKGVAPGKKAMEVSSTDASGTGSAEIDPLVAEQAAAESAKHSTVEDRMSGVEKLIARMKKTAPEIAKRNIENPSEDRVQAKKETQEKIDAIKTQKETAKEADIDALQEMAAADQAELDAGKQAEAVEAKVEVSPETQRVLDDAEALIARLKGETSPEDDDPTPGGGGGRVQSRRKMPKTSMGDKLRARQAEVKVESAQVAQVAQVAEANQETAQSAETAEESVEEDSPEDVAKRLGYESAEQAEEAQDLGEQIRELMKEKKTISADEFKTRKAELMKKVEKITGVKFEKSPNAPAEVEETPEEVLESKFDQLKEKENVSVEMTPALMGALKSLKNNLPSRYSGLANGSPVNMRFLGRGSTGKYEFLLPESITALAGDDGQETSAHVIRIDEADMEKILAGNEEFLQTQGVAGARTPLKKAA